MTETEAKVQAAIDTLFGKGITNADYLIEEFEEIARAFAYNHMALEDSGNARMGAKRACDAFYNLTALVDGLRGKNINKK